MHLFESVYKRRNENMEESCDAQEFHPYVFQIFAQLIELRPAPLPAMYMGIFPPLLSPVFWERHGNVPALVRLLRAYLAKAASEIVAQGHLQARTSLWPFWVGGAVCDIAHLPSRRSPKRQTCAPAGARVCSINEGGHEIATMT